MRWIVDEVDDLVSAGVLTSETGAALRRHYETKLSQEDSGGKVVLLSILGAVLIGAGIILIIAHNWDNLGRPVRTALSLLPLLVGIALSFWTLLKRADSTAWREGAGVAQCAGVAASIALVSQTYHISGELSDFLFTWLLLTLPVPYLLRAAMPAIIYLAGIAVWAGAIHDHNSSSSSDVYWLLLAGILPFYSAVVRHERQSKTAAWLSAALGVSLVFGLGFSMSAGSYGIWIPAFSGLVGMLYLAGILWLPERRYNPLRVIGGVGAGFLAVLLSFKDVWPNTMNWPDHWPVYALAFGFPCASFALLAWARQRKEDFNLSVAALPIVTLLAYGIHAVTEEQMIVAIIFNLYAFVLALGTAFRGLQQRAFATLNGGLLIFVALIVSRFVDSEFSIVARGIAFVVLGCLLLGANLWMLKTNRGVNS